MRLTRFSYRFESGLRHHKAVSFYKSLEDKVVLNIITRIFICLYWVVLIGFNIRNFLSMEASKRNAWIYALIGVNAAVIVLTFLSIFF